MKALTLTEPWATLMALQEKRVETRSWKPPASIIGKTIAIHSAKGFPGWARQICNDEPFRSSLPVVAGSRIPDRNRARILCLVKVLGYRLTEDVRGQLDAKELAFGDYSDGRFAWMTEYVRRIENGKIVKGHLGLWDCDD